MDYSQLSREEVNLQVARVLGLEIYEGYHSFDYEQWECIGPLIEEYNIRLSPWTTFMSMDRSSYSGWEASACPSGAASKVSCFDDNPKRAIAICILMIEEGKND